MRHKNSATADSKNVYILMLAVNLSWVLINCIYTDSLFIFLDISFVGITIIVCAAMLGYEDYYYSSKNISSFFEISTKKLQKKLKNEQISLKNRKFTSKPVYLGVGYEFRPKHSRELHALLENGLSGATGPNQGSFQIQNLGHSRDVFTHVKDLEGHTLIFGTPGSGKTRFFDLLISQAIYRNDVVIVIDPKGDNELREKARETAKSLNRHFEILDTYELENNTSAFNLLGSSNKPTEIADRLTSLLENKSDFSNYASEAICAAVIALNYLKKPITISAIKNSMNLKFYFKAFLSSLISYAFENSSKEALEQIAAFCTKSCIDVESYPKLAGFMGICGLDKKAKSDEGETKEESSDTDSENETESTTKRTKRSTRTTKSTSKDKKSSSSKTFDPYRNLKEKARVLYEIYMLIRTQNRDSSPAEEEFEHLYSMCCKDDTYFIKVSSSVNPIMSSLSMSDLSCYFSKDSGAISIKDIYMSNSVLYVSLNALKNSLLCSYVGKLILADLCSFCGDIYARNHSGPNISVFVDETAEVCNEYLVQLLNKGRGAKASVTLATQTLSDFKKKFGSDFAATQFIGNCNNMIALRIKDADTAKAFTSTLSKTTIYRRSTSIASRYEVYTRGVSEAYNNGLSGADDCLFPDSALMMLPNFEYVAKLNDGRFIKGVIPVLTD